MLLTHYTLRYFLCIFIEVFDQIALAHVKQELIIIGEWGQLNLLIHNYYTRKYQIAEIKLICDLLSNSINYMPL